jgi:hypothetical protein
MLHGFDLTGIRYDASGEPREWFSPESRLRLEARLDCVARQYGVTFWKKVSFKGAKIDVQVTDSNCYNVSGTVFVLTSFVMCRFCKVWVFICVSLCTCGLVNVWICICVGL